MKTFARLIRRYVLATAGIILVVVALLLGYLVPLYYMVGAALGGEEPFSLVSGAWPLLATAYYVWQGIFFDRWGSAWLVFPTIPLVCIAFDSLDKWWRHRK